jgi:hypothetical protein
MLEGAPIPGHPFGFRVSSARPSAPGYLVFSLFQDAVFLPAFGGEFFPADPLFLEPFFVDGAGSAPGILQLASVPSSLCGVTFVAQAAVLDGQSAGGASLTKAVRTGFGEGGAGPLFELFGAGLAVGGNVLDSVIMDFDGDQIADIAALGLDSTGADEAIAFVFGNGDGTFGPTVDVLTGGGFPSRFGVGDVNADGHPDIATSGGATLQLLLGQGGGSFWPPVELSGEALHAGVEVTDVNADGLDDLLVTRSLDPANDLQVRLSLGDGSFTGPQEFAVASDPVDLVVADLDQDGILDVATANLGFTSPGGVGSTSVLLGNGDGTFAPHQSQSVGLTGFAPAQQIEAADLDADGILDLVVQARFDQTGSMVIFRGLEGGTFSGPTHHALGHNPRGLQVVDVDRDLVLDIVCGLLGADESVAVLHGVGDGTFLPYVGYDLGDDGGWWMSAGDLDGDHMPDLVIGDEIADELLIARNGTLP